MRRGIRILKQEGKKTIMPKNYVTLKIIETRDGEFVLYLHNHEQKLISEQHRSGDLDEVVDRLKEKISYRKHFMNALNNFVPVLEASDTLEDK